MSSEAGIIEMNYAAKHSCKMVEHSRENNPQFRQRFGQLRVAPGRAWQSFPQFRQVWVCLRSWVLLMHHSPSPAVIHAAHKPLGSTPSGRRPRLTRRPRRVPH